MTTAELQELRRVIDRARRLRAAARDWPRRPRRRFAPCGYCGRRAANGVACSAHSDLPAIDVGTART